MGSTWEEWRWTEQEWLLHLEPDGFFRGWDLLVEQTGWRISARKTVLFMVACLRRVQNLFQDERSRTFVDAIEQYADGLLTLDEINQLGRQVVDPPNQDDLSDLAKEACSDKQLKVSYVWDALMAAAPPLQGYDLAWDANNVAFSASSALSFKRGGQPRRRSGDSGGVNPRGLRQPLPSSHAGTCPTGIYSPLACPSSIQ
jgi:hypothetical protein